MMTAAEMQISTAQARSAQVQAVQVDHSVMLPCEALVLTSCNTE